MIKPIAIKKLAAAYLLLVIMIPVLSGIWLTVAETLHKIEMHEKLEEANLQTIEVNISDITWVEKDKELLIKGKLFDVKSYSKTNNKIKLTGLYDAAEDEIDLLLNKLENTGTDENSLPAFLLTQSLCPAELISHFFKTDIHFIISKTSFAEFSFSHYLNPVLGINTPPPNG